MTAPELTADELARVAAFDAAPVLAESSPLVRAMLALAEDCDKWAATNYGLAQLASGDRALFFHHSGMHAAQVAMSKHLRSTVAAVLAADPEPREEVVERMARAMFDADRAQPSYEVTIDEYRRLAASALDASRGATQ